MAITYSATCVSCCSSLCRSSLQSGGLAFGGKVLLLLGACVGAPDSSGREMLHSGRQSLPFGFPMSDSSHLFSFPCRLTEISHKTCKAEHLNDCANSKRKEKFLTNHYIKCHFQCYGSQRAKPNSDSVFSFSGYGLGFHIFPLNLMMVVTVGL